MSESPTNENINEILDQLADVTSTELTLSDLVTGVHKSLIYSQHNIRDTELEELKRHYDVVVNETTGISEYTSKTISLDGTDINEHSLTTQHSLTINEVNVNMKVNLDKLIERSEKKEVVISKYDETGDGISTILDFKLNIDSNLVLPN